jgi:hypothetical protein
MPRSTIRVHRISTTGTHQDERCKNDLECLMGARAHLGEGCIWNNGMSTGLFWLRRGEIHHERTLYTHPASSVQGYSGHNVRTGFLDECGALFVASVDIRPFHVGNRVASCANRSTRSGANPFAIQRASISASAMPIAGPGEKPAANASRPVSGNVGADQR